MLLVLIYIYIPYFVVQNYFFFWYYFYATTENLIRDLQFTR